ncbi:MAG: amino acid adenylation domain-containing protein [Armatimonadota bacterium]
MPAPAGFIPFSKDQIEQSLVQRFQAQVLRHPRRTAVSQDGKLITYQALDRAANGVAHAILTRHGEVAEPVALFFSQGIPFIIALLAVLKSGKFFLPLDPAHPDARNASLLADAGARLLVTGSAFADQAAAWVGDTADILNIDTSAAEANACDPALIIAPNTPAYLLYTSGSTGRPKGVIQSQRNVLHYIMNYTNGLRISEEDRLTVLSPCSFSASYMDIFAALLNGATLYPRDLRCEGMDDLAEWLHRERISVYHSVPTVFRHFVQTLTGDEPFTNLRAIDFGGEPVTRCDIELFQEHFPRSCRLVNGLGMTELNVIRQFIVDHDTDIDGELAPVGYPVEDTDVLLLDEEGNPAAPGEIGEIVIRSSYLSPGYWQQPELTQALFQQDPHGGPARLYRTGDVGRMTADGCLTHLGRKDFQLKIRGHRIEAAEVETALLTLPHVREAVVAGRSDIHGALQLVAYLVCTPEAHVTVTLVQQALRRQFPDYMVPSAVVMLDTLPLTTSGKVDRQALPSPDLQSQTASVPYAPPRTPLEETLTTIWRELFGIERVGIHDDFFELGGHSLLAVRFFALVGKQLGRRLPLATIIQAPTIAQLAEALCRTGWVPPSSPLVPFQTDGTKTPFFCVHPAGGQVITFHALAARLDRDQPFYGIQEGAYARGDAPLDRIEDIAARYLREIRHVQPAGPYLLGGYSFGGLVAYEIARQLTAQGERIDLLVLFDRINPVAHKSRPVRMAYSRGIANLRAQRLIGKLAYIGSSLGRWSFRRFIKLAIPIGIILKTPLPRYWHTIARNAYYRLVARRYRPGAYAGRLVFFRADANVATNADLGWEPLAAGGMEVCTVPGDHNELFSESHVDELARQLRKYLENAQLPGE